MKKIRIAVVEDHSILRESLVFTLSHQPDFEIAGSWENGEGILEFLTHDRFDVALVDRMLPGMNGITLTRKILEVNPEAKIIMLSMMSNEAAVEAAFEAGAVGYLSKQIPLSELMEMIKKVWGGEKISCYQLAEGTIKYFTRGDGKKSILAAQDQS